jgi:ribosomal protein L31
MTTQCPKCQSENTRLSILIVTTNIRVCGECNTYWTDWQQAIIDEQKGEIDRIERAQKRTITDAQTEISRLCALLKSIEEHPHCANSCGDTQDFADQTGFDVRFGERKGHRCSASIASKANK